MAGTIPLILLLLVVGACSRDLPVCYAAAEDLNRNEFGESTPVILQLFELRRDGRFRQAAFDSLWSDAESALADDLVRKPDQVVVFPGDADREFTIQGLDDETAFLGVLGRFRKARSGQQRSLLVPIDEVEDHRIHLTAYGLRLVNPDAPPPAGAESH